MKLNKLERTYFALLINAFEKYQKAPNWKRYSSKTRNMDAYYNENLGLVVKKFAFILDDNTPKSVRVPTYDLGNGWVLQPMVQKINLKAAKDAIASKLKKYPNVTADIHVGNVGWYNGKPVMFDW